MPHDVDDSEVGPGQELPNGLQLVRKVGEGGMGEVWLARDHVLLRDVAVKLLHKARPQDDPDATDQFTRSRREARACARVVHPNVATVYGIGTFAARPYIAMEWIDGPTLRAVIDRSIHRDLQEISGWISSICEAVAHAHDRGVIHCDIKPENIMMQSDADGSLRPRLLDFGLARGPNLAHRRHTQERGTRAYLAPEAGLRRPTPAIDQYALAVTFCELLGRKRPRRHRGEWAFPRSTWMGPAVQTVLGRALARDPRDRFADVSLFRDTLLGQLAPAGPRPAATKTTILAFSDADDIDEQWLMGLPMTQLTAVVLGLVATAPTGFEEAVELIAPFNRARRALADLATDALVDGGLGGWALREPGLAELLLDRLPGPVRRGVARAVARALCERAGRQRWMRDQAIQLYVAGGDLLAAATVARDAAQMAVTARDRDRRLADAVALTASPRTRLQHVEVQLERARWLLSCGWCADAQNVLTSSLEVASELELPPTHPCALGLRAAEANLRLLRAEPKRALQRLESLRWQPPTTAEAAATETIRALALVQTGEAEQVLKQAESLGDYAELTTADWQAAWAAALRAVGDLQGAQRRLRRALAQSLDTADTVGAAARAVELTEVLLCEGRAADAVQVADDAEELLTSLGAVRWVARLAAARGEIALLQGASLAAMRALSAGLVTARQIGCLADELTILRALHRCCLALHDEDGANEAQAQLLAVSPR